MFSERAGFNLQKNHLALLLAKKRESNVEIIDLTESNPTKVGFDYPADEILNAISLKESLVYSPNARGQESCRNSISGYYSDRGVEVCAEDILLTSSTSEAYSLLFKLLTDPGDQILVPRPSYPLFDFLAQMECVRAATYPIRYENGWYYELETLESHLSPSIKAIVLVNPNNPTGTYIDRKQWVRLRELCLDCGVALICDEVFVDYCISEELRPFDLVLETDLPSFFLNGLSKCAGLPQMKLAWILVRGPSEYKEKALEHLEVIADTFLSVNTPVQHAASSLMRIAKEIRGQILRRIRANYGFLLSSCAGTPVECLVTQGGWYATLRLPRIRSEEEWALKFLESTDTLVHPGYFFDFEPKAYVVVSLLPDSSKFEEGVTRLLREI